MGSFQVLLCLSMPHSKSKFYIKSNTKFALFYLNIDLATPRLANDKRHDHIVGHYLYKGWRVHPGKLCVLLLQARLWLSLQWRHNGYDNVSNHQPHDCLLNSLFKGRSKKTSKLRATGLCAGNSLVTGEFPAKMASNAENVSISWRHHNIYSSIAHALKNTNYDRTLGMHIKNIWLYKANTIANVILHYNIKLIDELRM